MNCSTDVTPPRFFPAATLLGNSNIEDILQNADLSVPVFEQSIKNDILLDKFRNLITGSALVTEREVRQEFEKQNVKVKFDYAVLRKDDLLKQIQPTEAELKAFYERNKASLQQFDSGKAQSPLRRIWIRQRLQAQARQFLTQELQSLLRPTSGMITGCRSRSA